MQSDDILETIRELEEKTEAEVQGLLERATRQAEAARRKALEEVHSHTAQEREQARRRARESMRQVWLQASREAEQAVRDRLARSVRDPEHLERLVEQARPLILVQVAGALAELEQE